jgi:DNA-binding response OmpR family regulator
MKILIIDDEPSLRQTVSTILNEEGYDVLLASDGRKGWTRPSSTSRT